MSRMSKLLVPGLVFAMGNASALFADDPCAPKACCQPTCCPPVMETCCNVCPPTKEVTPNGGPCVMGGNDVFLTADFLWWGVREEGLEYAMTPVEPGTAGLEAAKGRVYTPNTKWNPGFKVGLGTDLGHDGWDLYAEYTWFHSNHGNSTPVYTTDSVYDAYWFVNVPSNPSTETYTQATESWKLNFNVLDLSMGRNMYLSPRLQFRPFFGLKGAWLKQRLNVAFQGLTSSTYHVLNSSNHLNSSGVGVRGGFDTAWHFTRGFSFVGNMSFTGFWDYFNGKRQDSDTTYSATTGAVTSGPTTDVYLKQSDTSMKPIVEWMIGLRYEFWTCGDDYHFSFEADWEEQQWFGQNHFIRMPGGASPEGKDLAFQGLTFEMRFDF